MKSSHYYKLLVFALSLLTTNAWAAGFGDIPASLALPAGTSVRRNAGDTLFESFTPITGNQTITLSGDVTGSGATAITTTQSKHVTLWVNGAGIILGTGTKVPQKIVGGGTLSSWDASCTPSCSITIDLLRSANGGGLPITSMVGSGTKPAISSNTEASGTITDWTGSTTLTDKDNLAISLSGITAATYVNIVFNYK